MGDSFLIPCSSIYYSYLATPIHTLIHMHIYILPSTQFIPYITTTNTSKVALKKMGLEDIYSTKLTLSLGSDDVPHREYDDHHLHRRHVYRQNKRSKPSPISDNYLPSLSLGLPWELKFEAMNDCCLQQASPAPPSSFSDSSLKREREIISGGEDDEVEAEKGSPGDEYQDDEVVGTRKKLRLNKEQSVVLEDSFKQHTTLNSVILLFPVHLFLVLSSNLSAIPPL